MIKMRVPEEKADEILSQTNTDYRRFQQGLRNHWQSHTDQNRQAQVTAQSICWLFCWAATGGGSSEAARQAQRAFDCIFDTSYDCLSQQLTLEKARKYRYKKGNISIQAICGI